MRLDTFERWTSFFAISFLAGPIASAGLMLIHPEDRVTLGIYGILSFCTGVALKLGSRRLRTNLRSGLRLIEACFYASIAITIIGFVYRGMTGQISFASVAGITSAAANFAMTIGLFFVIKRTIDNVKADHLHEGEAVERGNPI